MRNNIPWSLITKKLHHQAGAEEEAAFGKWLNEDAGNKTLYEEVRVIFNLSGAIPETIVPDMEKAWKRINSRTTANTSKPALKFTVILNYAAAAMALLALGVALHLVIGRSAVNRMLAETYTEIVAPAGQKAQAVLPDGTKVWLNAGSSLRYNGRFNRDLREVTMTGELFFEVKKDPAKQFRVNTGELRVDVFGTSFNIKNHPDDNFQEITIVEGTVGLNHLNREIRQMTAGQQAVLDKTERKIGFRSARPALVTAWKQNELVFDNTPIEEVVKYLERWYGVSITIDDAMRQKHSYTFKIKTETFREMMELMKRITPLTYEISGKEVRIKYANKKL